MLEDDLTRSHILVDNFAVLGLAFFPVSRQLSLEPLLCNPEKTFFLWEIDTNKLGICAYLFDTGFVVLIVELHFLI